MQSVIVLALYAAVFVSDFIVTRTERSGKDKVVYCLLLSVSFVVLLLYSFDIPLPSPAVPITGIIERVIGRIP